MLRLREFLDGHRVVLYSEHLSYCSDDGHLYDLMPIPFTAAAVRRVVERIGEVQDVLGRRPPAGSCSGCVNSSTAPASCSTPST